jgi:hypothetical protein
VSDVQTDDDAENDSDVQVVLSESQSDAWVMPHDTDDESFVQREPIKTSRPRPEPLPRPKPEWDWAMAWGFGGPLGQVGPLVRSLQGQVSFET